MLQPADLAFFQSAMEASSGGEMSTLQLPPTDMCSIFPDVTRLQARFGGVDYRKIFCVNMSAQDAYMAARTWFLMQPTYGVVMGMGLGSATDTDGTPVQYVSPTDYSTALLLRDLNQGSVTPIWIRRTVYAGTKRFDRAFFQLAMTGTAIPTGS